MGLDTIVQKISYAEAKNRVSIIAKRVPTEESVGSLEADPFDLKTIQEWEKQFGEEGFRRPLFWASLRLIEKHNANYQTEGSEADLGFGTTYTVEEKDTGTTVMYYDEGKDGNVDSVTVSMLDAAGKTFKMDIAIENGVSTFINQALAYLHDTEPTPSEEQVAQVASPTVPDDAQRGVILSEAEAVDVSTAAAVNANANSAKVAVVR